MPISNASDDVIAKLTKRIDDLETAINELQVQLVLQIDRLQAQMATRSVTTTTPPTADGTGLPGFVVLDTKPEIEYKNYVYIYPRN